MGPLRPMKETEASRAGAREAEPGGGEGGGGGEAHVGGGGGTDQNVPR